MQWQACYYINGRLYREPLKFDDEAAAERYAKGFEGVYIAHARGTATNGHAQEAKRP